MFFSKVHKKYCKTTKLAVFNNYIRLCLGWVDEKWENIFGWKSYKVIFLQRIIFFFFYGAALALAKGREFHAIEILLKLLKVGLLFLINFVVGYKLELLGVLPGSPCKNNLICTKIELSSLVLLVSNVLQSMVCIRNDALNNEHFSAKFIFPVNIFTNYWSFSTTRQDPEYKQGSSNNGQIRSFHLTLDQGILTEGEDSIPLTSSLK